MPTTPNGLRYPGNPASEPPNGPLQIGNLALDADTKLVGRFTSMAALNTAYPNPIRGMVATINDRIYVRTSTAWVSYGACMRAQRNANNDAFPNNVWQVFGTDTNWSESDAFGMRGTGATLVAPWTGWYQINASVHYGSNSVGSRGLALQPAAGVSVGEGAGQILYLGYVQASGATVISGSHLTPLNAGNTVQIAGFQNSGGTLTVNSIRFSASYVGP